MEYLEDGVVVTVPRGSKIKDPIRDGELKGEIEIKTDEAGPLNTPRGNFQVANKNTAGDYVSGITSLFYKWENGKMRIYTKNKVSGFFNNEGELDFTIINPSNDGEIYFVSSTKDIDASKNTVIVNDKEIGSVSVNGLGPAISIGAGSRLRGRMSELSPGGKTLSFQSKNGYAVLSNGANGDNPLIRLRGDSVYSPDGVSFTGDAKNNKFYYNPGPKIEGVTHGTGAIPINARLLDNGNKNLPYVILSNDQNQHVLAPEKDISNPAKYFVSDKGNVFSAKVSVNLMSPQERKVKFGVTISNQMENQIHKFINQYRGSELEYDKRIAAVSLEHSKNMAKRGYIGHYGLDGRIKKLGGSGSENVAMFPSYQKYTPEQVGKRFANMWIGSQGHRENILRSHSRTGVGVYMVERRKGYYEYYATQIFQ